MPTRWMTFRMDQVWLLPKRSACVYALYSGQQLVYIGKTVNIYNRFATGHRYKRTITHAKARRVNPTDLDVTERRLVRRLRPKHNHKFTGRYRPYGVHR